jgi:hypothetical protein
VDSAIDYFSGELSFVGAGQVFARHPGGLSPWYTRRIMTTKDLAGILGRDESTLRQQAGCGQLSGTRGRNGWRFSWQDVSDYVADGLWKPQEHRFWTPEELDKLARGEPVPGRSPMACRIKRSKIRREACKH